MLDLVDLQKPENDYIVLESISREKVDQKLIFIIHFKDKKSIKLGRHHDTGNTNITFNISLKVCLTY